MHVGSNAALSFDTHDAPGAKIRKAIFKKWKQATLDYPSPDALIINGDCIDGNNKKQNGIGTWSPDLLRQCDEAAELIDMWKAKNVFIIKGSGYHVIAGGTGLHCEELIARKVKNACKYPNEKDFEGDYAGFHWYISIEGVTFHVSHKIPVSKVFFYKSTPLAKELLFEKLNSMLRHEMTKYKTNIVLRAHGHSFVWLEYAKSAGCCLPGWKGLDEHMLENGAVSMSPDFGFIDIKIEGESWDWHKHLSNLNEFQSAPHRIIE
jgi:hypothetical protein